MDPIYVKFVEGMWRVTCPFYDKKVFTGKSPIDVKADICFHLFKIHGVSIEDGRQLVRIENPQALPTPLAAR